MRTNATFNGKYVVLSGKVYCKTKNPDVTDIILQAVDYWWITTGNSYIPYVQARFTEEKAPFIKKLIKAYNDGILDNEELVNKMRDYLEN